MRLRRLIVLLACALGSAGCPTPPDPAPRPQLPKGPSVRAFTESSSVNALATISGYLFAGTTHGLDRWDLRTGEYVFIGSAAGLPGQSVTVLAPTPKADQIWIATDAGVALYDLATESLATVPQPVPQHAAALSGLRSLAPDPNGGAWVGGSAGLYHVDLDGVWHPGGFAQPVTALFLARESGDLWLGARGALVVRHLDGTFDRFGEDEGLAMAEVKQIAEGPGGEVVALGADAKGRSRLAFRNDDGRFSTFAVADDVTIAGAARLVGELVLATNRGLYVLSETKSARTLRRNGLHLRSVAGKRRRNPYVVGKIDVDAPPDPTATIAVAGEVIVGTRALGTARLVGAKGATSVRWLRRRELVAGAVDLSVACVSSTECYVATGSNRMWRHDPTGFHAVAVTPDPIAITLAVVRSLDGEVLALHRSPDERALHVSRLEKGRFLPLTQLSIETPGGVTSLSFAKFAPDGLLWLGLQYLDEENEARPYGVATVDLSLGLVTYHHERRGNDSKKTGILPVPNDVVDVAFLDEEIWLATLSGAARLNGEDLTVYTEAEGLDSELLHGVVATEGGLVFVGAKSGVAVYDGSRWSNPRVLKLIVHSLGRGSDGRLWMGTERGVAVFDGQRVQRFDRRSGLLEDRVEDISVDHMGRVWARSPQGFSLVVP